MLIVGSLLAEIQEIKEKLQLRFQMSDLKPCYYCLAMSVRRDRRQQILSLTQHKYIEKLLRDFGMNNAKPAVTPMETSRIEALPDGYESPLEDKTWYARVLLGTRVGTAYSISFLSRYLGNLSLQHMCATKTYHAILSRYNKT